MTKEKGNAMMKQQPHYRSYQKPSIWFRIKEGIITVTGGLWTVVLVLFRVIMLIMGTPLLIVYFLWNLAKGALFGVISLVIGKFLVAFALIFYYDGFNAFVGNSPSRMPDSANNWMIWWLGGDQAQIISQWWDYAFIITFAILMAVTLTFSPHE